MTQRCSSRHRLIPWLGLAIACAPPALADPPEVLPLASEVLADTLYDAENLAFDGEGRLFVTGGDGVHLITFDADNAVARVQRRIVAVEANFVGAAMGPDGDLYVGCLGNKEARVLRVHGDGGDFVAVPYANRPLGAPNGLRFDDDGTLYVADFGYYLPRRGGLWAIRRDSITGEAGAIKRVVAHASGVNGVAIDRDRARLYFTRTMAGKVYYLERRPDGLFGGDPALLIDFDLPGPRFPLVDDLALDEAGNLYVCLYNADQLRVVTPDGTWTATLEPQGLFHPTAVAFGVRPGDRDTLYITQKGRIMVHDRRRGDRVTRSHGLGTLGYLLPFAAPSVYGVGGP